MYFTRFCIDRWMFAIQIWFRYTYTCNTLNYKYEKRSCLYVTSSTCYRTINLLLDRYEGLDTQLVQYLHNFLGKKARQIYSFLKEVESLFVSIHYKSSCGSNQNLMYNCNSYWITFHYQSKHDEWYVLEKNQIQKKWTLLN